MAILDRSMHPFRQQAEWSHNCPFHFAATSLLYRPHSSGRGPQAAPSERYKKVTPIGLVQDPHNFLTPMRI